MRAECRGGVLAVLFLTPQRTKELWLFEGPTGRTLTTLPLPFERDGFALSPDGRQVAVQCGACQVEVRETLSGVGWVGLSSVGRFHNNLVVELGSRGLYLRIDRRAHYLTWATGVLQHYADAEAQWTPDDLTRAVPGQVPSFLNYDRSRFRIAATNGNLVAVVTLFGEAFLFEKSGELVCGFFVFRQQVAAWMPDGTCWGAVALLGRPETPGAAARIGKALSNDRRTAKL